MPKVVSESLGLYRQRLHPVGTPPGTHAWWQVSDATSANVAVHDMVDQLERDGWPVLDRLLSRDGMLEQVRHGDLGMAKQPKANANVYFARAEALLLMDMGPGDALYERLSFALENATPEQSANAERFDAWVRVQVRSAVK